MKEALFLIAAVIALGVGAVAAYEDDLLQDAEYHDADHRAEWSEAQELEAAQQDAAALASREFAGQQVCGPAALATWQDDKTLVCTPKRDQPYRVAEQ